MIKHKERIQKFLNYNESDIRSCFYHIGNTDVKKYLLNELVKEEKE